MVIAKGKRRWRLREKELLRERVRERNRERK
jgi:hypothetical protein